jgi:hypothetical protein
VMSSVGRSINSGMQGYMCLSWTWSTLCPCWRLLISVTRSQVYAIRSR